MLLVPTNQYQVVRLDTTVIRKIGSILFRGYIDEPLFRNILEYNRPGYSQRVRATIREMIRLHFRNGGTAVGILDTEGDRIVGVALINDHADQLDLSKSFLWRLKMSLTAGVAQTRNFIRFKKQIQQQIPRYNYKMVSLLTIEPEVRRMGLGTLLIQAVQELSEADRRCKGVCIESSKSDVHKFYFNMGYYLLTQFRLDDIQQTVYLRKNVA